MNSKDIEKKREEKDAELKAIAKKFKNVFDSGDGKEVFQFLFDRFLINNDTEINSPNVNYEAAYHNGEAGVIKFIISQINRASN